MVTRYVIYEEDRRTAQNCRNEILVLKLENPFSQSSGFVPGRQNR